MSLGRRGALLLTALVLAVWLGSLAWHAWVWVSLLDGLAAQGAALPLEPGQSAAAPVQAALQASWPVALQRAALATAPMALALLAVALLLWWRWQRPWRLALAHAAALEQGRLATAPELQNPALNPELGQFMRSLDALALRLRQGFDAQAHQVALLQRQAQADPVTGLPRREPFRVQLKELLADPGAPMASLLLVRAQRLEQINQRLGHEDTNRLLCAVADVLGTYLARVPGSFASRLNGSDFALCLPASGIARETGESLLAALQASPLGRLAAADWAVGALDGVCTRSAAAAPGQEPGQVVKQEGEQEGARAAPHPSDRHASAVLAAADAALAEAEAQPGSSLVVAELAASQAHPAGARAWRTQINQALAEGRVQLAEQPVRDARGRLLHLQCSLQVQLQPGGLFQAAQRWLALAARSRLLPQVDLAAVGLALEAIARDGRPRALRLAAASLAAPEFASLVQRQLQAAPRAAAGLWLELSDTLPRGLQPAATAAVSLWRAQGAHTGVEHAGAPATSLVLWQGQGLEAVKVAARHLQGVADDASLRDYASSLLALVRGLGAQAMAEGITEAADLQVLWELGWDGAAGAAVAPLSPDD